RSTRRLATSITGTSISGWLSSGVMRQILETLVEKSLESRRRNQAATGRVVCVRRARLQSKEVSVAACPRIDLSHINLARAARQARASMPRDSFNREIDYLRISVID